MGLLDDFMKENFKKSGIAAAVLAIVCLPFHWQWSVGFLTGTVAIVFNHILLAANMTKVVVKEQMNIGKFVFFFFLRSGFLAIPLRFAILYPHVCNVYTTAIAMLLSKALYYAESFKKPKEGDL